MFTKDFKYIDDSFKMRAVLILSTFPDSIHFFTGDLLLSNLLPWQQGTLYFQFLNFRILLIHIWEK